jgi:hypothetical protein
VLVTQRLYARKAPQLLANTVHHLYRWHAYARPAATSVTHLGAAAVTPAGVVLSGSVSLISHQ